MPYPNVVIVLLRKGLSLKLAGDNVRVWPPSSLSEEDRTTIRAHKVEIIEALRAAEGEIRPPHDVLPLPPRVRERLLMVAGRRGMDAQDIAVMFRQCESGFEASGDWYTPEQARALWLADADDAEAH